MPAFIAAHQDDIVAGRLTVTWRLWKYAHYKAGGLYATNFGGALAIEDVRTVRAGDVTDADAREGLLPDAVTLIEVARDHTGAAVDADTILHRVQFHYVANPPTKPPLSIERLLRVSPGSMLARLADPGHSPPSTSSKKTPAPSPVSSLTSSTGRHSTSKPTSAS